MTNFSQYQHFNALYGAGYYLVDDDIIPIVPPGGFCDNAQQARKACSYCRARTRLQQADSSKRIAGGAEALQNDRA